MAEKYLVDMKRNKKVLEVWYIVERFVEENDSQIRVHWKNYDDPEDYTWEPKKRLKKDLGAVIFDKLREGILKVGENKST
tara:strand:+ start:340 stop:579 length:240 start_codon:yes stop_codon:yes gene_type:complete